MLLELAYEAIENAGVLLDDFIGSDTAVYAGSKSFIMEKAKHIDIFQESRVLITILSWQETSTQRRNILLPEHQLAWRPIESAISSTCRGRA